MVAVGVVFLFILVLASMVIRVIPEYERAVVFRLGRVMSMEKGPGLFILIPVIDKMVRVSVRTITMDIDPQDVITKDNVSLKVNAVLYFRVISPIKSVVNVENYLYATGQLAQTHLRSILGEHTLDQLLSERDKINTQIQSILDENTDPWGIKVEAVEIKHIDLPPDMQRAMAKEAESERERRAKIIAARGELEAAEKLRLAADKMSGNPSTLQLRYLQTLNDISSESSHTIVFPIPMNMLEALQTITSTTSSPPKE